MLEDKETTNTSEKNKDAGPVFMSKDHQGGKWLDAWAKTVNEYIKKPLRHGIVSLSRTSARHPGKTILITIAVSITLAATGVCTNLEIENTVESYVDATGFIVPSPWALGRRRVRFSAPAAQFPLCDPFQRGQCLDNHRS